MKLLLSILIFSSLSFGQIKYAAVSSTGNVASFDTIVELEAVVSLTDKVYKIDFSIPSIEIGIINISTTVTFPSSPSASLDCTVICKSQDEITILGDSCLCFQKTQPALVAWSLFTSPVLP